MHRTLRIERHNRITEPNTDVAHHRVAFLRMNDIGSIHKASIDLNVRLRDKSKDLVWLALEVVHLAVQTQEMRVKLCVTILNGITGITNSDRTTSTIRVWNEVWSCAATIARVFTLQGFALPSVRAACIAKSRGTCARIAKAIRAKVSVLRVSVTQITSNVT